MKFETRCSVCYVAFAAGVSHGACRSPLCARFHTFPMFFACFMVLCLLHPLLIHWSSMHKSITNPQGFSLKFETRRSVCYVAFAAGVSHGAWRSPLCARFHTFPWIFSDFFNGVALGVPRFGSALGLPCALGYRLFQCFFDILLELGRLATLLSLLACAGVG